MNRRCSICHKNEVPDKGKGFRVFMKYDTAVLLNSFKDIPAQNTRQIRICPKCLKKDYQEIEV